MRIAGKVEAIVRSRQDEAPLLGRHDVAGSLATSSTNGGDISHRPIVCRLWRPVIVSNAVVIVDVFGSLHAARGQGRTLDKRRESRASAPVSRSGQPPLSGLSPNVLCCRERPVAETITTVEEWGRS